MRKIFVLLSLLVVASMALSACGGANPAATQAPAANTAMGSKDPTNFVEATFGDPETFDPALDYETAGASIIQNTYDSLLFYNGSQPGVFVPNLADSWTISPDGKTYVFTLHSGVKFHNGDPMTASDAAYTFQRGLLQANSASPQWLLYEAFFGIGTSDISDIVIGEINSKVSANATDSLSSVDLTKFDEKAFGDYFTAFAAFYTKESGYAVDAAKTLGTADNKKAVTDLLAAVKAAKTDDDKKKAISGAATTMLGGADGGDPTALLDDSKAMTAVDPAILKDVATLTMSKIVADDTANTLTFNLANPWGPLLANMAQTWGVVMDKKWVVANGGWDGSADTWQKWYAMTSANDTLTKLENGTGPFKLDHWTPGQEIVLTRNDDYWRTKAAYDGGPSGPAALKTVTIKNVTEWGTRFSMLQAGDADIVAVPPENRAQVDPMVGKISIWDAKGGAFGPVQEVCGFDSTKLGADKFKVCAAGEKGNGQPLTLSIGQPGLLRTDVFLNFNIRNTDNANPYLGSGKLDGNGAPSDFFNDINVRQAFNYCFDWDTFNKDVFDGEAVQSTAIPLPGMPGYSDTAPHYTFSLDKCKAAFQASTLKSADGKSLWDTGFRMSAVYNQGNTTRQKVAEILAANINQVNPKFIIETVGLPWPAFLAAQRAKTLPMFISGWLEDIHDPHDWYVPYLTQTYGSRQSMPAELKAKFQDLMNQGVALSDPAARDAVYQKLNQAVYDAAPDIILSFATGHGYEQNWVSGLVRNPIYPDVYYYGISKK